MVRYCCRLAAEPSQGKASRADGATRTDFATKRRVINERSEEVVSPSREGAGGSGRSLVRHRCSLAAEPSQGKASRADGATRADFATKRRVINERSEEVVSPS